MNVRRNAALVIVAAQALLLVGLIAQQQYRVRNWPTYRLAVAPIDPWSLFQGRYVRLSYNFSSIQTAQEGWKEGDRIYIHLAPGEDGLWQSMGISRTPEAKPGEILLRGTVDYVYPASRRTAKPGEPPHMFVVTVRTGLESYYLSERKAPEIERLRRGRSNRQYKMTVDVGIAPDGRAVLKQLYVQGVPAEDFEPEPPVQP